VIESCCLVHASPRSCLLLLQRASSRSSSGVLRVFLMCLGSAGIGVRPI
jgi:hypothetical protein